MKEGSTSLNMLGKIVMNHPTLACLLLIPHLLKNVLFPKEKGSMEMLTSRKVLLCFWIYNKCTIRFPMCTDEKASNWNTKPLRNNVFFLRTVSWFDGCCRRRCCYRGQDQELKQILEETPHQCSKPLWHVSDSIALVALIKISFYWLNMIFIWLHSIWPHDHIWPT